MRVVRERENGDSASRVWSAALFVSRVHYFRQRSNELRHKRGLIRACGASEMDAPRTMYILGGAQTNDSIRWCCRRRWPEQRNKRLPETLKFPEPCARLTTHHGVARSTDLLQKNAPVATAGAVVFYAKNTTALLDVHSSKKRSSPVLTFGITNINYRKPHWYAQS